MRWNSSDSNPTFVILSGNSPSKGSSRSRHDGVAQVRAPMSLNALRKFVRLSATEQALVMWAAMVVIFVRVFLWLTPRSTLRYVRALASSVLLPRWRNVSADRIAWGVRIASRPIPAATCLTQALALQCLLARSGRLSVVPIGVRRDSRGVQVHAWVELDGQIVLDTSGMASCFVRLATLQAGSDGDLLRRSAEPSG
jgi:hypothetical protein